MDGYLFALGENTGGPPPFREAGAHFLAPEHFVHFEDDLQKTRIHQLKFIFVLLLFHRD